MGVIVKDQYVAFHCARINALGCNTACRMTIVAVHIVRHGYNNLSRIEESARSLVFEFYQGDLIGVPLHGIVIGKDRGARYLKMGIMEFHVPL
jgi:hypothetical protein